MGFELQRAGDLDQLRAQRARTRLEQADHLHGERGRAGDDMPASEPLQHGPPERQRIDAGMGREALVLDVDEKPQIGGRHRVGVGRQAP